MVSSRYWIRKEGVLQGNGSMPFAPNNSAIPLGKLRTEEPNDMLLRTILWGQLTVVIDTGQEIVPTFWPGNSIARLYGFWWPVDNPDYVLPGDIANEPVIGVQDFTATFLPSNGGAPQGGGYYTSQQPLDVKGMRKVYVPDETCELRVAAQWGNTSFVAMPLGPEATWVWSWTCSALFGKP